MWGRLPLKKKQDQPHFIVQMRSSRTPKEAEAGVCREDRVAYGTARWLWDRARMHVEVLGTTSGRVFRAI